MDSFSCTTSGFCRFKVSKGCNEGRFRVESRVSHLKFPDKSNPTLVAVSDSEIKFQQIHGCRRWHDSMFLISLNFTNLTKVGQVEHFKQLESSSDRYASSSRLIELS